MKLLCFFILAVLLAHTTARPPGSLTDCEQYPNPADCHKWIRSIRGAQDDVEATIDDGLDEKVDELERTTTPKDTKERDLVIAQLIAQNQPHPIPFISFPASSLDDLVDMGKVEVPRTRRRRQPFPIVEADQKDLPEETVQLYSK